jgi:hypothetical protein
MDEITISHTLNIDNFENVKPTVTVSMSALPPDAQTHSELYDYAYALWLQQAWWELNEALERRVVTEVDTYVLERQLEAIQSAAERYSVELA